MTDNIKLPPLPEKRDLFPFSESHIYGYAEADMKAYAREAVRLNAQAVPCDPTLREAMQKIADLDTPTNIVDVMDPVARKAVDIAQEALSAAPPAPQPAQHPLTDQQCDAIYMALDNWAQEFDEYEFGLPHSCGGGVEGGREIIRQAHGIGVKND